MATSVSDFDELGQKWSEGNTGTSAQTSESRNYAFTSFALDLFEKYFDESKMKYLIIGKEKCPTTGKEHLQGYVNLKSSRNFKYMKKNIFKNGEHFAQCIASPEINIKYCKKDGDFKEWGTMPNQGKRTDLIKLKDDIMSGERTVRDITLDDPMAFHQYGRTLKEIENIKMQSMYRTEMTEGIWYYGKTDTGKSHRAYEGFNPDTHYLWCDDHGFWMNYRQQDVVLINEFRGQIPYYKLLELVDKYPLNVPVKGGYPVPFISKKVIVTSSLHPREIYHNLSQNDKLDQLYRRFKIIECIDHHLEREVTEN